MRPFSQPIRTWLTLADLEIKSLCLPWQSHPSIEEIDPYLPWLDASHHLRRMNDPSACPASLQMFVKLSTPNPQLSSWHPACDGNFLTFQPSTSDVLKLRAGFVSPAPPFPALPPFPPFPPIAIDATARAAVPRSKQAQYQPAAFLIQLLPARKVRPAPVMAVIDDGCPFAHQAYRSRTGGTRVIRLWDQGAVTSGAAAPGGYGREWDQAALDQLISCHRNPDLEVDEDACYRELDPAGMALEGARYRHGAHVLGLAAGAPDPWAAAGTPPDAASEAPIIFISLPRDVLRDTSGGALASHVFDALRYIDSLTCQRDEKKAVTAEIPVVVCLALGASAGPHDGSSLIEQAIGGFIEARSQMMVFAAAGNGRDQRLHGHHRIEPGQALELPWEIAPDDGTDNFLELWWRPVPGVDGNISGHACLTLKPPSGEPSPEVGPGGTSFALCHETVPTPAVAGIVSAAKPSALSDTRCALLAVAATASDGVHERQLAASGGWTVLVRNGGASPIEIDAYIERDDPSFGGRAAQSRIADRAGASADTWSTLGSLTHGFQWFVAGGYLHAHRGHGAFAHELDEHSGEGPGRVGFTRAGPDFVAPSGDVDHPRGVLSYGVHSGEFVRARGTSASTAFAARRLYNRWCAAGVPHGWSGIKQEFPLDARTNPMTDPLSRVGAGWLLLR